MFSEEVFMAKTRLGEEWIKIYGWIAYGVTGGCLSAVALYFFRQHSVSCECLMIMLTLLVLGRLSRRHGTQETWLMYLGLRSAAYLSVLSALGMVVYTCFLGIIAHDLLWHPNSIVNNLELQHRFYRGGPNVVIAFIAASMLVLFYLASSVIAFRLSRTFLTTFPRAANE